VAIVLLLGLSRPVAAQEVPTVPPIVLPPAPPAPSDNKDKPEHRSYLIPAFDIVLFETLLNGFDRQIDKSDTYRTNAASIRRNLHTKWVVDSDPFQTNQFLHPYQGAMYHGFARSAGLGYWTSMAYTFGGSVLWEIAGETSEPSKNDQIASGIAGSFLGEPLFRMASMVANGGSSLWRALGATAISPATGFNRGVFGDRFDRVFSSRDAPVYARLHLGASLNTISAKSAQDAITQHDAVIDFGMEYGRPGKPGYVYNQPFDYFTFQATGSRATVFETVMSRGTLAGRQHDLGDHYRSVWGLYGSYDYVSPQVFRVSTTAVSFGTTLERKLPHAVALQGTALVGVGYGAAGTTGAVGQRDYHYGVTPQVLLAPRLVFGRWVVLDLSARDYFVSRLAGTPDQGRENIARAEGCLTARVNRSQAVSVRYVYSRRDASYPGTPDRVQARGAIAVLYTLMSDAGFGAVRWRQ